MNVLSLFDGISCGQLALERAGVKVDKYFASEIDKYAIQITQKNYPNTIQLGDVNDFNSWDLPKIDLIIGGSPCQDLSCAGKKQGIYGKQSSLFFKFVDALKKFKPKYFLLENNASMTAENRDIITKELGVEPILINSSLLSAQTRKRLYWTNIPNVGQPDDKGLLLKDIVIPTYEKKEYECWNIIKVKKEGTQARKNAFGKMKTLFQKANCLGTTQHITNANATNIKYSETEVYIPTPVECERLQTLPDNYTEGISKTQRYKAIGNGWTVDVIAHIFKAMVEWDKEEKVIDCICDELDEMSIYEKIAKDPRTQASMLLERYTSTICNMIGEKYGKGHAEVSMRICFDIQHLFEEKRAEIMAGMQGCL